MPQPRIVSLIPSGTELVAALGLADRLVGRSHECDFPPTVTGLPICSEPRIDVHGSSGQIDKRVKQALQDAVSIYRVHTDVLRQLQPTVIVTQAQCDVCAVSYEDLETAVCEMLGSEPEIVSLEPNRLVDVENDIHKLASALAVPERGESLIKEFQTRLAAIDVQTGNLPRRPTVACIEWIDPLMAAGNWIPELIQIAGGVSLFGEAGIHSPWLAWNELVEADPDVIVIVPCGFDIDRSNREMPVLSEQPQWAELQAVRHNRVFLTDGNQFFNRPGPRLVESAEILAELLHPDQFDFGYAGSGWVPLGLASAR